MSKVKLIERIKAAYGKFTAEEQVKIRDFLLGHHNHALSVLSGGKLGRHNPDNVPEFSLMSGALGFAGDLLESAEDALFGSPDSTGVIYGTGKYEALDIGWLEAGAIWLENWDTRAEFGQTPATASIDSDVTMAVFGDWGTGIDYDGSTTVPAKLIQQAIVNRVAPDLSIHLGDVYYTGEPANEQSKLVEVYPRGSAGNWTLNSNHEMYPGGVGYFGALAQQGSLFAAQRNTSYFALENDDWAIVALDTAYYANFWNAYLIGNLLAPDGTSSQLDFLEQIAQSGKQLILLSHHNALSLDGQTPQPIWSQVLARLSNTPSGSKPVIWYWGHAHNGAVYQDTTDAATGITVMPRLSGHAAVPYTVATELTGSSRVQWAELSYVSGDSGPVKNGFSVLQLQGSTLIETFYDQDYAQSWSNTVNPS